MRHHCHDLLKSCWGQWFIYTNSCCSTIIILHLHTVSGLKSAMVTRVLISVERLIIVYFSFDAELQLKKLIYVSLVSWGIGLILVMLHIIIVHPRDNACLHIIDREPYAESLAIAVIQCVEYAICHIAILTIFDAILFTENKNCIWSGNVSVWL